MIGAFNFNTIESSVYSLVCKSIKRPLLPAVKVRRVEPVGVSGSYDFDDNEYSMRGITMRIAYVGTDYAELRTRARTIAGWLSIGAWSKLIINDEPDKYYLAKVTDEIDLDNLWESGTADITFDCQPFAYSVTEEVPHFHVPGDAPPYVFTNPGTRVINYRSPQGSKFEIEVIGSWTTLVFTLNGLTLNYNEAGNGTLVIDNIEMEAAMGVVNKYGVLSGAIDTFLNILPGVNTLTIGGTGLAITVTVKYVPLWL